MAPRLVASFVMSSAKRSIRVLLNGGDNMLGRGVQLSAWHQSPGDAAITDSMPAAYYLDAALHPGHDPGADLSLTQIRACNRNGAYLWGDYLGLKLDPPPDLRLLNLETAVTTTIDNDDVPHQKGINYHLHCNNLPELFDAFLAETHGAAHPAPVVITFANNHALDFGRRAFEQESLPLFRKQFNMVGAGADFDDAARPFTVDLGESHVQVFAMAAECSGTPLAWAATERRSGLAYFRALRSDKDVDNAVNVAKRAFRLCDDPRRGVIRIVSIHWGPNWAYRYASDDRDQLFRRMFAHRLIDDCGVHLIYGHSSHHIRGFELYHHKLIVYGAGDLVNDYEGFENVGDEMYPRFGAWIVVDLSAVCGELQHLRLIPTFMDRLRLTRLRPENTIWHPPTKSRSSLKDAGQELVSFLNRMSAIDSGGIKASIQFHIVLDGDGLPILEA